MIDRLRHEHGMAYSVTLDHQPLSVELGHASLSVASAPDHWRSCIRELARCLDDLVERGVLEAFWVPRLGRRNDAADEPAEAVHDSVTESVHGRADPVGSFRRAVAAEIDAEDVRAAWELAQDTCLLLGPTGTRPTRWTTVVRQIHEHPVGGRAFTPVRNAPEAGTLTIGPDGATLSTGTTTATVRAATCALMIAWTSGTRLAIAANGAHIQVRPQTGRYHRDVLTAWDAAFAGVEAIEIAGTRTPGRRPPAASASAPSSGPATMPGQRCAPCDR